MWICPETSDEVERGRLCSKDLAFRELSAWPRQNPYTALCWFVLGSGWNK